MLDLYYLVYGIFGIFVMMMRQKNYFMGKLRGQGNLFLHCMGSNERRHITLQLAIFCNFQHHIISIFSFILSYLILSYLILSKS